MLPRFFWRPIPANGWGAAAVERGAAAPLEDPAVGHRRIKPCQFGLELFVDQQQRPQSPSGVPAATGDNLVDGKVVRSVGHPLLHSLHYPRLNWTGLIGLNRGPACFCDAHSPREPSSSSRVTASSRKNLGLIVTVVICGCG